MIAVESLTKPQSVELLSFVRFSSAYNKEVTSKSNLDACLATLLQHAQWVWSNDMWLWLLKDQLEQCRDDQAESILCQVGFMDDGV